MNVDLWFSTFIRQTFCALNHKNLMLYLYDTQSILHDGKDERTMMKMNTYSSVNDNVFVSHR